MSAPLETVEIGNARLEYAWHGPGPDDAPTILLLHEGLGCVAMWRDFPAKLSERTGLGVLAYTRQGYGGSDPVTVPRPLTYMHDEAFEVVPKLIDRFRLRKVVLAGHSDGASIAAIHGGGVRDPRVLGLVLMAPHFFNEELCVRSIEKARENYEHGDLKPKLERFHGRNVHCAFYGWNKAWLDPDFMLWNIEEFLPLTTVPVLILWGETDPYGTIAQARTAEEKYGGPVEVKLMPDSTHWPFQEEPEASLDAIAAFTAGLTEGSTA